MYLLQLKSSRFPNSIVCVMSTYISFMRLKSLSVFNSICNFRQLKKKVSKVHLKQRVTSKYLIKLITVYSVFACIYFLLVATL